MALVPGVDRTLAHHGVVLVIDGDPPQLVLDAANTRKLIDQVTSAVDVLDRITD